MVQRTVQEDSCDLSTWAAPGRLPLNYQLPPFGPCQGFLWAVEPVEAGEAAVYRREGWGGTPTVWGGDCRAWAAPAA